MNTITKIDLWGDKMKKFAVSVTEVNYGAIIVEASDEIMARSMAMESYHCGEIHWTNSEISIVEVHPDQADGIE